MSILKRKSTIWLSFGLAMGIYGIMLGITLPHITQLANGGMAFDMRPMGYSFQEAQAFLASLSQDGRQYYLTYQLGLDMFYPAFLAIFLFGVLMWFASKASGIWHKALRGAAYFAFIAAAFDYAENIGIAFMLMADDVHIAMVQTASTLTVAKSLGTTLVFLVLIGAAAHQSVSGLLLAIQKR